MFVGQLIRASNTIRLRIQRLINFLNCIFKSHIERNWDKKATGMNIKQEETLNSFYSSTDEPLAPTILAAIEW